MSFDTNKSYKLNNQILGKFKEKKVTQYDETHSFRGDLHKPVDTIEYIFEFANLNSIADVTEATQDEYDQEVKDLTLIRQEKIEFNTDYTNRVLNIKTNLKDFVGKNVTLYDKNEKVIDGFIEEYDLKDNKLNFLKINGDKYYLTNLTSNQQNKTFFNRLRFIGSKHDEIQNCLKKLGYSFESSANIKETGVDPTVNSNDPPAFNQQLFVNKLTERLTGTEKYTINIKDFSGIVSFFDNKKIGSNYEIQPITRSDNEFKFDDKTGEKDDSEHTYYEFSLKGELDESSKVMTINESSKVMTINKFGKVVHFMGGAPQVPITLKIRLKVPIKKEEEKKEEEEEEKEEDEDEEEEKEEDEEEEEEKEEEPQTQIDPLKKSFGMYHGCEYKLYEFNGEITDTEITGDNLDTIVRYLIFSNIVVFIQS